MPAVNGGADSGEDGPAPKPSRKNNFASMTIDDDDGGDDGEEERKKQSQLHNGGSSNETPTEKEEEEDFGGLMSAITRLLCGAFLFWYLV